MDDYRDLEVKYDKLKNQVRVVLADLTDVNELTNTPTELELRDADAGIDKAIHGLEVALKLRKE